MAKTEELNSFDEDALDFDVDTFFSHLFETLQNYRSSMSIQEGTVVESPTENSSSKSTESNVNAFYRLLGLPAVRADVADLSADIKSEDILSQHKTLNYFPDFQIDGKSVAEQASAREQRLYKKLEYQESIDIMQKPLLFINALNGSDRRTSILPLVVNAAVPIYPMARRTAPIFNNGEFFVTSNTRRLTRPFIEHIVYMRTKVFAGFDAYTDALIAQANKELEGNEAKDQVIEGIKTNNLLGLRISNKLLRALRGSTQKFKEIQDTIEGLRKQVQFLPAPKDNPAERSGNISDALSENLEKDPISEKSIEVEITDLKAKLAAEDLFLKLLPSRFILRSDSIKRSQDIRIDSNVSDDVFLSEFNSLTTFERTEYNDQLRQAEDRKARFIAEYEEAKRTLLYLNGQVTGLSIIDVICIFLALFTVDIKSLLAIINPDSLNNLLNSDLYYKTNPGETAPSESTRLFSTSGKVDGADIETIIKAMTPGEGLKAIQDKVKENFKLAESFYTRASKKSGENRA